jgi:hypothetical protein
MDSPAEAADEHPDSEQRNSRAARQRDDLVVADS